MDGKLFIVEYIFIELVSHTIWKVLYTLCLSKALPTKYPRHYSPVSRSHGRPQSQVAVKGGVVVVGGPPSMTLSQPAQRAAIGQPPESRVLGLGVSHGHCQTLDPFLKTENIFLVRAHISRWGRG